MSAKALKKFNLIKAVIMPVAFYLIYITNYLLDYSCREFIRNPRTCWVPNIFLIVLPYVLFLLIVWFAVALINNVMVSLLEKSGKMGRDRKRRKSEELFK